MQSCFSAFPVEKKKTIKKHSFFSDPLLPQYFYVPEEHMADERAEPTTQSRLPSKVSWLTRETLTPFSVTIIGKSFSIRKRHFLPGTTTANWWAIVQSFIGLCWFFRVAQINNPWVRTRFCDVIYLFAFFLNAKCSAWEFFWRK